MQILRSFLFFAILVAMIAGCNDGNSARFANIDGLAGGYGKYESGLDYCVWGYLKRCSREEIPESLRDFPFVYKFYNYKDCQGKNIFVVSAGMLATDKSILICGTWIKTAETKYLRI